MANIRLSEDITPLKNCALRASQAVLHLWDKDRKTFWRSTEHRKRDVKKAKPLDFFPTVSLRSIQALLKLLAEFPEWIAESGIDTLLRDDCLPSLVKRKHSSFRTTLNPQRANAGLNPFTLSLYVDVFATVRSQPLLSNRGATTAFSRLCSAIQDLLRHSTLSNPADLAVPRVHPFLLYHASRALANATMVPSLPVKTKEEIELINARIREDVRSSVERLLAKHALKLLAPCDSVALAFCAASLALHNSEDDYQRITTSLNICFEAG